MNENLFPAKHPIGVEFFSKKSTKTFQLINNTDSNKQLDAKKQWYSFDFAQPVYIFEVSVSASGYESWNEIDFEIEHIDGTTNQQSVQVGGGVAALKIGKLSKTFRFRPIEKVFSSPKLQKVTVVGFTLDEFHSFEWALKEYETRVAEIESRDAKLKAREESDKGNTEKRTSLESEIGKSRAEAEKLKLETEAAHGRLENLKETGIKLKDEISTLEVSRSSISLEVSKSKIDLQTLKNEIRLFPSEIAGFVKEGNRSIWWYLAMAIPFVIVIFWVLFALFSGSTDLTQLWKEQDDVSVWIVFLTRIPFVLIALALLEVCGYVVGRLFSEIIRINRQRLALSKLSIIARDVSVASAQNFEFDNDQLYENEVKLKMEMLRAYMTEDLGLDFEYKGTFIQQFAKSVVDLVSSKK
jgi:hypothetical protein